MAHVFISYKSEDRERLRPLVAALESAGFAVWWDARIEGGSAWRLTIERELESAACVLVAWSARSVGPEGHFVRDEAAWALARGTYLPLLLDEVRLPLGFGEVQALSLVGWRGDGHDARIAAVTAAVRAKLAAVAVAVAANAAPAGSDSTPRLGAAPASAAVSRRRLLLLGSGAAALVAAGGGLTVWRRRGSAIVATDPSIAVLPFANLSGDPAEAYFADGLAEELRSALARLGRIKVIARVSCESVRNAPVEEAARRLGVRTVLTGSLRRSPTLLRVSTQLVDAASGVELWSETYDRAPGDALAIQSDVAQRVSAALRVPLGVADRAVLDAGGTRDSQAYDLVLKVRSIVQGDTDEAGFRGALELADRAVARDPAYAAAHLARGVVLQLLAGRFADSAAKAGEYFAAAESACRRAVELAPAAPRAQAQLGEVLASRLELPAAWPYLLRARDLGGDDADVLTIVSGLLGSLGRSADALALSARAETLDPANPTCLRNHAFVLLGARRYDEAIAAGQRALSLAPRQVPARYAIFVASLLLGRTAVARSAREAMAPTDPDRLICDALLAARTGTAADAEAALARLRHVLGTAANYQYAQIAAQRGDADAAFAALEAAWAVRDAGLTFMPTDPLLDPVHGDPRFAAMLARLRIPG